MIKDDRILKPRLRHCPFCGDAGAPELLRIGAIAFVRCNHCKAEGPYLRLEDFLPYSFSVLTADAKNAAWDDAEKSAIDRAAIAWNLRPWEGAYYPDELEGVEALARKLKLESSALYGRSCSDEAVPCGD